MSSSLQLHQSLTLKEEFHRNFKEEHDEFTEKGRELPWMGRKRCIRFPFPLQFRSPVRIIPIEKLQKIYALQSELRSKYYCILTAVDLPLFTTFNFFRIWNSCRAVGDDDVSVTITHCGICYADVFFTRNRTGTTKYPLVPGHEMVGIVKEVGANVSKFKVGDRAGVGTYLNSCRDCEYCNEGSEVNCAKGLIFTIDGTDVDGNPTRGGFSTFIVAHERYCYKIPDGYPPELAAPLLCAGITVYNPMIQHRMNTRPGKSLGVIGLGGLGHMAVKFGKAFGLKVTVLSTSMSKKNDALNLLGADRFVLSSDSEQMGALGKSLDFIIDTASGNHPFDSYMALLKPGGVLVLVGGPSEVKLSPMSLIFGSRSISGSAVGSTRQTQEMIDFCAEHKIYPEIELIPIQYANEALERLEKNDVKYRFVIDIASSLN